MWFIGGGGKRDDLSGFGAGLAVFLAGNAAVGEDEVLFFDFDQYVEGGADVGHFYTFFADGGDGFIADLVEESDLGGGEI